MGFDNVPFHTILFPALLIAGKRNYSFELPDRIFANHFLLFEGKVCSKTDKIGIWLDEALSLLEPDYWRYYLYRIFPDTEDTNFTWEHFQDIIDQELLFIDDSIYSAAIIIRNLQNCVSDWYWIDPQTKNQIEAIEKDFVKCMRELKLKEGLRNVLDLVSKLHEITCRSERELSKRDTATCLGLCRSIGVLMNSYLPLTAIRIWGIFSFAGKPSDQHLEKTYKVDDGTRVSVNPKHLFQRVDTKKLNARLIILRWSKAGTQKELSALENLGEFCNKWSEW
jgi:methionyl-tRNA synthetase